MYLVSHSRFWQKNENDPLELHTITNPSVDAKTPGDEGSSSLAPSVSVVPRLISVVEIIKREYIKTLELKHSARLQGLHQYNYFGCLEEPNLHPQTDEERTIALNLALEGKH
jgi:hypothetical protein